MAVVTIIGAGMMGSALAFPARENGNEVRLVGTHLDREIIDTCRRTGRHPKFKTDFPAGVQYYQIEEMESAVAGADMVIANGADFHIIHKIMEGRNYGTLFVGDKKEEFFLIDYIEKLL